MKKTIIRKMLNWKFCPLSRVLCAITVCLGFAAVAYIFCIDSAETSAMVNYYGIMALIMGILAVISNIINAILTRLLYYKGVLKRRYVIRFFFEN